VDQIVRVANDRARMRSQRFEYVLVLPLRLDSHHSALPFNLDRPAGFEHFIEDAIDVLPKL